MTYWLATLIVGAAALAAAACSWLIGRLIPVELRRSRHDVGGAIFAQIGILYSVLLAFVFSEVWGEYNIAAQAINAECGALHGAAMVAHALPGGSGAPVIAAVVRYDRLVLDAEWPAMARREASNEATRAFQAMIEAAASVSGLDADHSGLRGQIVSLLADAHAARETRTFQIKQALPLAVWGVLIALAALLVVFVLCAGVEYPVHIWFSAAFAACIVLVLVLVRMLDYPFEGALALGNGDFVRLLGHMLALAPAV